MMDEQRELGELQRWMLNAVIQSAESRPEQIDQLILPSRHQSAADRLGVYQHAYVARLLEVLREQFPCTRFAVGDALFDQFASGYLQKHPPHSYTLGRLADHWVGYLEATRPADWGEFLVELSCLEHAIDRVFDSPGPESAPPFMLPPSADASLRLIFVPGFELLAFRYPVSSFYTDWKADRQPPWPDPLPQFVALFRRDFVVRRHELTERQYSLLAALERRTSLGEALECAADKLRGDDAAEEMRRWFASWAAAGFFASAN